MASIADKENDGIAGNMQTGYRRSAADAEYDARRARPRVKPKRGSKGNQDKAGACAQDPQEGKQIDAPTTGRNLGKIGRSVSFSIKSESRSYSVDAPSTALGDKEEALTKTHTPQSRRNVHRSQSVQYAPSVTETILEDDLAFSFLDDMKATSEPKPANRINALENIFTDGHYPIDTIKSQTRHNFTKSNMDSSRWNPIAISMTTSDEEEESPMEASMKNDDRPFGMEANASTTALNAETFARVPLSQILRENLASTSFMYDDDGATELVSVTHTDLNANDHPNPDLVQELRQILTSTESCESDIISRNVGSTMALNPMKVSLTETTEEIETDDEEGKVSTGFEAKISNSFTQMSGRTMTASTLIIDAEEHEQPQEPASESSMPLSSLIPPDLSEEVNVACELLWLAKGVDTVVPGHHDVQCALSLTLLVSYEKVPDLGQQSTPSSSQVSKASPSVTDVGIEPGLKLEITNAASGEVDIATECKPTTLEAPTTDISNRLEPVDAGFYNEGDHTTGADFYETNQLEGRNYYAAAEQDILPLYPPDPLARSETELIIDETDEKHAIPPPRRSRVQIQMRADSFHPDEHSTPTTTTTTKMRERQDNSISQVNLLQYIHISPRHRAQPFNISERPQRSKDSRVTSSTARRVRQAIVPTVQANDRSLSQKLKRKAQDSIVPDGDAIIIKPLRRKLLF